jgi:hypothetical protein
VERFIEEVKKNKLPATRSLYHDKIELEYTAGFNYKRLALHVSVARIIELFNSLKKNQHTVCAEDVLLLLQLMYPFTSFFAEDLWYQFCQAQKTQSYKPLSEQIYSRYKPSTKGYSPDRYVVLLNSKRIEGLEIDPRELLASERLISQDRPHQINLGEQPVLRNELHRLLQSAGIKPESNLDQMTIVHKKKLVVLTSLKVN